MESSVNVFSLNIQDLFSDLERIFSKSPPLFATKLEKFISLAFESMFPYIAFKSATERTSKSLYGFIISIALAKIFFPSEALLVRIKPFLSS